MEEEQQNPYIMFQINNDEERTVSIKLFPGTSTSKHYGALLYLVQSGGLANQVVQAMDAYGESSTREEWVNTALIEWFTLVMQSGLEDGPETDGTKHKRKPAIRARDVFSLIAQQGQGEN